MIKNKILICMFGVLIFFVKSVSAREISCNGKSECASAIKSAINSGSGAVCFSNNWIPKPEQGWPEECRTEFYCGKDDTIALRAYFPPMGQFAKWVTDPHNNTNNLKYIGACLHRSVVQDRFNWNCSQYTDWALSPASASVNSQGELLIGSIAGKSGLEDWTKVKGANPEVWCRDRKKEGDPNGTSQKNFTWWMLAKKSVFTNKIVINNSGAAVKQTMETDKVIASGNFLMKGN